MAGGRVPDGHERWDAYLTQITGWPSAPDGSRPVYLQTHEPSGATVRFAGRTLRERGRLEVFLEGKLGFQLLAHHPGYLFFEDPEGSTLALLGAAEIVREARRQLTVLPAGARLEWHFADGHGAAGVQRLLEKARLFEVNVSYTPEAGR